METPARETALLAPLGGSCRASILSRGCCSSSGAARFLQGARALLPLALVGSCTRPRPLALLSGGFSLRVLLSAGCRAATARPLIGTFWVLLACGRAGLLRACLGWDSGERDCNWSGGAAVAFRVTLLALAMALQAGWLQLIAAICMQVHQQQ